MGMTTAFKFEVSQGDDLKVGQKDSEVSYLTKVDWDVGSALCDVKPAYGIFYAFNSEMGDSSKAALVVGVNAKLHV